MPVITYSTDATKSFRFTEPTAPVIKLSGARWGYAEYTEYKEARSPWRRYSGSGSRSRVLALMKNQYGYTEVAEPLRELPGRLWISGIHLFVQWWPPNAFIASEVNGRMIVWREETRAQGGFWFCRKKWVHKPRSWIALFLKRYGYQP